MNSEILCSFTKEEIHVQLQKIIADPLFCVSDILKRFLLFVTEETLQGRSNQIKEYTIGVNVLHKPTSFNPRQDAIVRIHAGRLRRALHQYYKDAGSLDPIYVSIPKGCYQPVFAANNGSRIDEESRLVQKEELLNPDFPDIAGPFVVTGNMQYADDRLRISVQMINSETHEEMWNQVVEYKVSKSNAFDIQDDIAKKLASAVGEYYRFIKQHVTPASVMAVA
jgi:hypothetical protein